jgi:Transposase
VAPISCHSGRKASSPGWRKQFCARSEAPKPMKRSDFACSSGVGARRVCSGIFDKLIAAMLSPTRAGQPRANARSPAPSFAAMRALAMRFRGMMRSGKMDGLDAWIRDAAGSGIYGMRVFARGLRKDLAAVQNALTTKWSNGQVEGQINRLKTLKRAMYGRISVEVLRARLPPLPPF